MALWKSRGQQAIDRAEADIAGARHVLSSWIARIEREGAEAAARYGNGVGRTGAGLSERFGVSIVAALAGRQIELAQLHGACIDMTEAFRASQRLSRSPFEAARSVGEEELAGIAIMMTVYRMRVLAATAQLPTQRDAADNLADELAALALSLAQIAARE